MRIIIFTLLLSGCTVTSGKIALAEHLCTLNGGVDLIGYSGNVLCENGALFTSGRSKASGEG